MGSSDRPFVFPSALPRETAQEFLVEAYQSLDDGKILRQAIKLQRSQGLDPPMDVQYVAEPSLVEFEDGLGLALNADILVYESFEGVEECLNVFERVLGEALMKRVEKKVEKWLKKNRS